MNELKLVELLTRSLPGNDSVRVGAGDDCAVLDLGIEGRWVLYKTDAVVENIHFTREAEPEQVGRKALARCLSDLAAMAGEPRAALITMGLPENFDVSTVEKMYAGINTLARNYSVAIVGGETVQNPGGLIISVAMIGVVDRDKCILRSGAKEGDALFVTGELGGSIAGHHLDFEPRVKEAQWLAQYFRPGAMIDVSDGLAGDLRHILRASEVGAELLAEAVPISRAAKARSRSQASSKPPLLSALTDGEDFELLFTVASKDAVAVLDAFKKQFPGLRLSCIGKITSDQGLRIRDKQGVRPLTAHGYVHFQKS